VRPAFAASRRLGRARCPRPPAAPAPSPKGSRALSSCALRCPTLAAVSAQHFPTPLRWLRCCASLRTALSPPRRPAVWTFPAVLPSVALLCARRARFSRGKRRPRARHDHSHVDYALLQKPFQRSTIVSRSEQRFQRVALGPASAVLCSPLFDVGHVVLHPRQPPFRCSAAIFPTLFQRSASACTLRPAASDTLLEFIAAVH
jgi:hypothetical protein